MTYDEIVTLVNARRLRIGGPDYGYFQQLINKASTQKFKDASNFFNGGNAAQSDVTPVT
jgi:hypothetical protein